MTKQTNLPLDTVLFDLDGTLVDSMPELAYCSNQTLEEIGRTKLPIDTLQSFVGKGLERLIIRFLANDINATTADPQLIEETKVIFNRHYHINNGKFSDVYPKVIEALNALKEMNFKLGVVTNKPNEFTIPLLEKKELCVFFDTIIGGDSCEYKKPHPAPVLLALEELDSSIDTAVLVGDSQNDAAAAKAAGLPCLMLPYGYNEGQTITKPENGDLVEDMMSAVDWIKKQNSTRSTL